MSKRGLLLRKGNLELRLRQFLNRESSIENGLDVVCWFKTIYKDEEKDGCMSVATITWDENERGCEIQSVCERILNDDVPFQDLRGILKLGCEILRWYYD